jgi:hypothetical protein
MTTDESTRMGDSEETTGRIDHGEAAWPVATARYASTAVDGETVVYDRQNADAWVRSTVAVDLGWMA